MLLSEQRIFIFRSIQQKTTDARYKAVPRGIRRNAAEVRNKAVPLEGKYLQADWPACGGRGIRILRLEMLYSNGFPYRFVRNFPSVASRQRLAAARSRSRSDMLTGMSFIALASLRYPRGTPLRCEASLFTYTSMGLLHFMTLPGDGGT